MDNQEFEINDDELEQVVGGFSAGDRVRMGSGIGCIRYCPKCSRLINNATGTISKFRGINSRGEEVYFVKMDCCGYEYPGGLSTSMTLL